MTAIDAIGSAAHPRRGLRFGILGAGAIAGEVAHAVKLSERCEVVAVASRDQARAQTFAGLHGIPAFYGNYEALLADPTVDVVYIATPHPQHAEWAVKGAQAGKHVLCEKPLTVNASEAEDVIRVARDSGVFLLEAFAYGFHPQTKRLLGLLRDRAVGQLKALEVAFTYGNPQESPARALDHTLAGGGILDVGCYCTSAASRIVGAALGCRDVEPLEILGIAHIDPEQHVDRTAVAVLRFPEQIIATLTCGVTLRAQNHIAVYGTGGELHVPYPCWLEDRRTASSQIRLIQPGTDEQSIAIPGGKHIFAYEVDGVADMIHAGVDSCHESWSETLANMRTLDRWRAAVGVHHRFET